MKKAFPIAFVLIVMAIIAWNLYSFRPDPFTLIGGEVFIALFTSWWLYQVYNSEKHGWTIFICVMLFVGSARSAITMLIERPSPVIVIQRNITEYQNEPSEPVQFMSSNEDLLVSSSYIIGIVLLALFFSLKGWVNLEIEFLLGGIAGVMALWGAFFPNMDLIVGKMPSDIRQKFFLIGWNWELDWSLAIFGWGLIGRAINEYVDYLRAAIKRGSESAEKTLANFYKVYIPVSIFVGIIFGLQGIFANTFLSPSVANMVAQSGNASVTFIGASVAVTEGLFVGMATLSAATSLLTALGALIVRTFWRIVDGKNESEED